MDIDRPHRSSCTSTTNSNSTSELFICFTSRLSSSSSSMKISSKSILSPGRSRDHSSQISLSTSISRRLRTNGSMRGGQASPMFPANNGKKRGSFENPEPSSPKVTCIGQVRVKTKKKQGKKMRSRSQRRSSGGGEISFRRVEHAKSCNLEDDFSHSHHENQFLNRSHSYHQQQHEGILPHRNQKWVHLPVTICEALRGFGAEFNCFLPCRSSCTTEKDKEEKAAVAAGESNGGSNSSSSCGAVFARWLVAVQEGDGDGKRREIQLMVGEEEVEEEDKEERRRSYRRHVFEEIDFKKEKYEDVQEEEEARVSVCVPPKNALLLMRCRSDPVKMAALANKFWEPPVLNDEEEEDKEQKSINNVAEQENQIEEKQDQIEEEEESPLVKIEEHQIEIEEEAPVVKIEEGAAPLITENAEIEETPLDGPSSQKENEDPESIFEDNANAIEEESNLIESVVNLEEYGVTQEEEEEEELGIEESKGHKQETQINCSRTEEEEEEEDTEEPLTCERSEPEQNLKTQEDGQAGIKSKERDNQPLLPDCLLLMMCEPKLSMEVSKETWVCSTDFIRWLPEPSRPVKKKAAAGDEPKKRNSIDIHPPSVHSKLQQPPRSSCSYPAKPPPRAAGAESMTTAIGQKLAGSKACEPFMLKRCKSEPMRTANKLAPENCLWKNRKLEPHRPATLGVGAAGVGC